MRRKNTKLKQYPLNGARINSVCISQITRKCFITGDSLNNIRFYEFDAEEETFCFTSNTSQNQVQSEVSAVAFNAEEKQIYAGSNRGIIHIWDIAEGKQVNLLKGHSTSVNCFGIFPQQKDRMASGSYDTNIKLWDIRDKNNYATLKGHTKQVNSIDISPDRLMLVSGSEDNTCKIWDLRYPEKIITTYNEHTAPVIKVFFNPDDMMFASSSMDKTAKYYRCEPPNHFNFVSSTDMVSMPITAITFDDEGKYLYTAANDTLKIWNMAKGGLLIQTIDSPWKGVQDICWNSAGGLLGVAAGTHYLSTWVFDEKQKVIKKPEKKESDSIVFPNINKNKKDVQKDLMEAMNNINEVMGVVNILEKQKKEKNQQKPVQLSQEEKLRILQEEKRKAEQLEQQRLEKQRKRQQQLKKEQQERERLKALKQQEERKRCEQLQRERIERERILQQKIHETFEQNVPEELQYSVQNDALENSAIMNLSHFMADGAQKQKLRQIELISDLTKDSQTFEAVIKLRVNSLKPIMHFWTKGKIESSIQILNKADASIVSDATTAILKNSKLRYGVTPEVAVKLLIILEELMKNKHGTYFKSAMVSINEIVNMFKEELIKIKSFNPMTKNDPTREERLAKYDRLIEEFLNIFKQERLKKYALMKSKSENAELIDIAAELYKNLEDVLKRLIPKKEPEPA